MGHWFVAHGPVKVAKNMKTPHHFDVSPRKTQI